MARGKESICASLRDEVSSEVVEVPLLVRRGFSYNSVHFLILYSCKEYRELKIVQLEERRQEPRWRRHGQYACME